MEATGVGAHGVGARLVRSRVLVATIVVVALAFAVVPVPAGAATTTRPGIDVSMWQGDVDWAAVSSSGERFAIIRATRGHDYVDPRYAEYLAGASANGLAVGAYHRAKPSLAAGDARTEADHFLDVAQVAAGDVLPVLDIEETGGLTVGQLKDWVRAWVARVFNRTGVRAMLYASPYFWRTNMGDTTWFADRGYPLWVAHWGVQAPNVPAADWGGHGWTYWQWSSTGSVPGIGVDVDRDHFNGSNLVHGTIASLTVMPAEGGVITGPRIRCGGGLVACTRLANPDTVVTLTAEPVPEAAFHQWTGACAAAGGSPTCDVTVRGARTVSAVFVYPLEVEVRGSGGGTVTTESDDLVCADACTASYPAGSSVTLTAAPDSASVFAGWDDACTGTDPACTITMSSPLHVVASFDSVVSAEEDGTGTAYAWARVEDARALGGSYRWERRGSASAAYDFSGGKLTVFTVSGPAMGRARVSVDGTTLATFDGFAPSLRFGVARAFRGLGPGPHTLMVTVLGTKRPAATGTRVAVDALRWGGQLSPDPIAAATWATVVDPSASDGAYAMSDARGAFARIRFHGTGATLGTLRGPSMGRGEVWVDGALVRVVDLYRPSAGFASLPIVSGLTDRWHVLKLVVSGTRRPASAGTSVVVDRWVVR